MSYADIKEYDDHFKIIITDYFEMTDRTFNKNIIINLGKSSKLIRSHVIGSITAYSSPGSSIYDCLIDVTNNNIKQPIIDLNGYLENMGNIVIDNIGNINLLNLCKLDNDRCIGLLK